jgi:hypothetical protein
MDRPDGDSDNGDDSGWLSPDDCSPGDADVSETASATDVDRSSHGRARIRDRLRLDRVPRFECRTVRVSAASEPLLHLTRPGRVYPISR